MEHLFNSVAQPYRLTKVANKGAMTAQWVPYGPRFACRLDLTFVRPGKDAVPPAEAGKAPDRVGVLFYTVPNALRASDRIRITEGPALGASFEVRAIPDVAQAYAAGHHMEVQVIEVAQQVATS